MFISSDTNIWFDFEEIGFLEHPFLLDNEYYISDVTYHDEIQHSEAIRAIVESGKLHITSVPVNELQYAVELVKKYPTVAIHDAIALSIAKSRRWTLLSGDRRLREAAEGESVECRGTLWIYSLLSKKEKIPKEVCLKALNKLLDAVDNKKRRLPRSEIIRMIGELEQDY